MTSQPSYFSRYRNIRFERSEDGIVVMSLHNDLIVAAEDGVFTLWSYFVGPGRAQIGRAGQELPNEMNGVTS